MNTHLCTIRIETLGCRLNQAEAESFASLCADAGFSLYHSGNDHTAAAQATSGADTAAFLPAAQFFAPLPPEHTILCFVNTCTVTGKAEQKARRLLRLLAKEHPHAVILVTGCYAQLEAAEIEALHPHILSFPGQQKDLLTILPTYLADLVRSSAYPDTMLFLSALRSFLAALATGKHNRSLNTIQKTAPSSGGLDRTADTTQDAVLPSSLGDNKEPLLPPGTQVVSTLSDIQIAPQFGTDGMQPALFALSSSRFLFHSRAFLKIQDGCNAACAYCRIRLARGKSISLPAADVLTRLRNIEDAGIPEVTLSGVNLSQYRSEVGDFADLLTLMLAHSKIRIRISSLYPDRIDAALIPLLGHPQICPHFHLSVQSGSNTVLKAMHRSYSREGVYRAVSELRRVKGNPFIGADIITGFPGETEQDFEETYTMCRELNFAGIHAFPFSARPGTEAWKMQPKVPERIAGQRVKRLNTLAQEQAAAYLHAWDSKLVYGVTEAPRNGTHTVITENYLSLPLQEAEQLHGGEYVQVRVRGTTAELIRKYTPYHQHPDA